jgi:hypothetical protein
MDKINRAFNKLNPLSQSIIVISILHILTYIVFDIVFDDKDDVGIQLIAKGFYTSEPNQYLLFINVILGYILKFLYTLLPNFYWYSLMLFGFQFVSMTLLLKHLITQKLSIFYYVLILLIFQFLIIRLQFTTVASLLLITGYLTMKQNIISNKYIILPLILIYLGFLMRLGMFLLMAYLFVMLFVFEKKHLKMLYLKKQNLIPLVITFILISVSFYVDYTHYNNKDWKYYYAYELERGPLNDNPMLEDYVNKNYTNNPQLLSDYQMIFKFVPLKDYDVEELSKLRKEAINNVNFNSIIKSIIYNLKLNNNIFLFILVIPLFIYGLYKKNYVIIGFTFSFLIIFLYISSNHTFKNRLSISVLLLFFVYFVAELPKRLIYLISLIYIPLLFKSNLLFYNYYDQLDQNIEYPNDKPVIALNSPWKIVHPFKLNQINNQKDIFVLGWMSNTHLLRQKIESYNINVPKGHFSPFDDPSLNKHFYYYIDNPNSLKTFNTNLKYKNMSFKLVDGYENIYKIID